MLAANGAWDVARTIAGLRHLNLTTRMLRTERQPHEPKCHQIRSCALRLLCSALQR